MKNISRSSKVPLYFQLYEILHDQIRDGIWKPEVMLPTENELENRYQLSRATVRQAFELLVNQGLVYRRRGQGTFVSRPAFDQNINRIISFWDDMQQRGLIPGTRVLSGELIQASEDVVESLEIEANQELASLVRLRLADDEPLSVEHSLLVHNMCPGILDQDYANNSLRKVLADQYNIHITNAKQKIRAVPATKNLANLLDVDIDAPLLHIDRISYTEEGTPIEYLRINLRGDRYTFHSVLRE
ncbi:MAG: GntR family transcriptional regulator [Anaerolineales bacterium]|nr:GntR family transcriptional regulator [Anaerolineales bacterium]